MKCCFSSVAVDCRSHVILVRNMGDDNTNDVNNVSSKKKTILSHPANGFDTTTAAKKLDSQEEPKTYKLYKSRWIVLLAFCFVNLSYNSLWITFSSISDIAVAYYTIEPLLVDWLSMSFLLAFIFFALPAAGFVSSYGLRATILLASILHTCGTFIRYQGTERDGFFYLVIGQLLIAASGPFISAVPPELATIWFGVHERAIATSIGVLMCYVGVAVGFLQPTLMVPNSNDLQNMKEGIETLLWSQAIFCSATLVGVVLLVKNKPSTPPSLSQEIRETKLADIQVSFLSSIKALAKDLNFNLTAQAYGIMFGLLTVISTLLNQLVKANFTTLPDSKIGIMGFVATIVGMAGILLFGFWIEAYQMYKITAVFVYAVGTICLIAFSISVLTAKSYALIFISFCVFNLVAVPYTSFGLEQIAEISYPVSEFTTCTFALTAGNAYGLVFTYVFGWMLEINLIGYVNYGFIFLSFIGFILVLLTKVPMKRTAMDHARSKLNNNESGYESTGEAVIV